ncbi:histidine kinase [Termitidicoccus mucosus]|uniref:histidine kinase n=1 Tax=Termitidicoccus mucosus TaxID=1184151 RepID=A0A178IG27_9BACT|nr:histidine kinase [Opitutaceae bacterium TSB47]
MKRFGLRTLSSQLIGVMLLAIALSQGVSLYVFHREHQRSMRGVLRDECLGRIASAMRLVQVTPPDQRAATLAAVSTPLTRYWLTPDPPASSAGWQQSAREQLLRHTLSADHGQPTPSLFQHDPMLDRRSAAEWEELPADTWLVGLPVRQLDLAPWNGFGFALRLGGGDWLNTVFAKPDYLTKTRLTTEYYAALIATALLFAFAAWLIARRISCPLRTLARSAERLGRGESPELLPEEGPDDIRATAITFNRMQVRLRRFVEDRTQMIAAISHDLRTPITSLRLRAEYVEDPEMREKMIGTLDGMQAMTQAVLAFAREESTAETTRTVDIDALIESVCDDLAGLGWDVKFADGHRIPFRCRPDGLKRALANIIENAVRYGQRARVHLDLAAECLGIVIDDDGPGIAAEDRERVFAPFFRLESSRNRATGGVGLGLAIARSIVRAHGGDIVLANRAEGGLRATIRLPVAK